MSYNSERSKSEKMMHLFSLILQVLAGLLILSVGAILIKKDHFNIASVNKFVEERDPFLIQMFGAICALYGAWRLYRGYTKYKES
jgi:hypothetical protein